MKDTEEKKLQAPHQDTVHDLKIWPPFFVKVYFDFKTFEVRKNDRNFQKGDWLRLKEWNPELKEYTGRECLRRIKFIFEGGQIGIEKGYVVMGLDKGITGLGAPLTHEKKY